MPSRVLNLHLLSELVSKAGTSRFPDNLYADFLGNPMSGQLLHGGRWRYGFCSDWSRVLRRKNLKFLRCFSGSLHDVDLVLASIAQELYKILPKIAPSVTFEKFKYLLF